MRSHDLTLFNASVAYGGIKDLSPDSVALCVMALGTLTRRFSWFDNGTALTDNQWDDIDSRVALAMDEIMGGLIGMVVPAIWSTASAFKFLPCDGATYNRVDFPLLYEAIDAQYILSGTQFTVPDLRRKVTLGSGGGLSLGDTGGSETVTLSVSEIPSHNHSYNQYTFGLDIVTVGAPVPTGVGQPALPNLTSNTGLGQAHDNMMPYYVLDWYVIAN